MAAASLADMPPMRRTRRKLITMSSTWGLVRRAASTVSFFLASCRMVVFWSSFLQSNTPVWSSSVHGDRVSCSSSVVCARKLIDHLSQICQGMQTWFDPIYACMRLRLHTPKSSHWIYFTRVDIERLGLGCDAVADQRARVCGGGQAAPTGPPSSKHVRR
jgi:hypothetical protein